MSVVRDPYSKHRDLLTIDEIRHLSHLDSNRVVRDVLLNWVWILAAWASLYALPTWWMLLLVIPIVGNRYYSIFIVGHDGIHRRLFQSREQNDRFNDLFIFGPIGAITRINKRNHLTHHRNLSNESDPDRHRHGSYNKTDHAELTLFLTGLSTLVPSLRATFFDGRGKGETDHLRPADIALLLGCQILLAGGLTMAFGVWGFPVLWLLPVFLFAFLADNFRSFAEHSHPEPDHLADEHRLITYLAPRWEREWLAPMNMNYHAAHHLWPSIPYYNLPKADALLRERNGSTELEWRTSYLAYLNRYRAALPIKLCKSSR